MTLQEIFAKVFREKVEKIGPDSNRRTLRRWDSFNHVQLIVSIEKHFKVELTPNEVEGITSFAAAQELLRSKGHTV